MADIFEAVKSGDVSVAEQFLNQGADISSADHDGRTLLHLSCIGGHYNLTEMLLKRGANINARDGKGRSPLHYALNQDVYDAYMLAFEQWKQNLLESLQKIPKAVVERIWETPSEMQRYYR